MSAGAGLRNRGISSLLILWLALPAVAQELVLEEVIVTAQKRTEALTDVPLSVTAVGGEKMASAGILDLADLSDYVPNFQKAETALGSILGIRGIGSGVNQGFEQSVVQYVDDVALGRAPLARVPFVDLARIEVLRGPQNVLFGKNAIAGALSMTSNKATEEFAGDMMLEYEPHYDTLLGTAVVSGPLSDKLRGRLALRYYDDDGYFDNNLNGHNEANREDRTLRGILSWDLSETFGADLKLERSKFEQRGRTDEVSYNYPNPIVDDPFYGLTYPETAAIVGQLAGQDIGSDDGEQDFRRNTNLDERSDLDTDNVTLTMNWFAPGFTLTSVTAYLDYETDELLDTDASGIDAFTQTQQEEYRQFSQEIRFTSPGDETVDWIAGLYYQDWDLEYLSDFRVDEENLWSALGVLGPGIGRPDLTALGALTESLSIRDYQGDSETYAVFAQATWNVNYKLRLTLGGRFSREDKTGYRRVDIYDSTTGELDLVQAITAKQVFGVDFANLGEATNGLFPIHELEGDRSEDSFTPSAIVEWDFSDGAMLYFSVSTGFKAGGFDARGGLAGDFEYEDEYVTAYELGSKGRFLNERLEINAALFYSDYEDLQVSQFDGTLGFVVGNAARAISQGLEFDGRWLLSEGLTWAFALAYLDFEFDDYENAACTAIHTVLTGEVLCDLTGRRGAYTPEWSGSTTLDYVVGLGADWDLRATLDYNFKSEQYVEGTLNEDLEQDAYGVVNARLGVENENWMVALVGKNLSDEEIISFMVDTPLSGTLNTPSYTANVQRPRTIALQARYRF